MAYIVEKIKYKYGINETGTAAGLFSFDPETFVLNHFTSFDTALADAQDVATSTAASTAASDATSDAASDAASTAASDAVKPMPYTEQFSVFYHLENDVIQYEKINPPLQDKH